MDGSRNNAVDISGMVINSPVTVNQNQDGAQGIAEKHIEYVIDESSARVFPREPVDKMNMVFYVTVGVSGLGILADMLGVLAQLGFHNGMSLLVLVPVSLIVALITKHDRWLASLDGDKAHFKEGLWYEKLPDSNFISYVKRAKCIYPKCEGLVHIVPAPPRERPNHSLVGQCSIGGRRHTYSVDYNGIGYPKEFDWRPVAQQASDA